MEEQGDLHSGGDVTEGSAGLPPRRPVARPTAPCVPAPWRQRAAYRRMQVSCGGQGTEWALPGREWGPGPREIPWQNRHPRPPWLQWPPQAPAMGPGPAHPGPGSPQVNAFCRHEGPEAALAFTGRGVGALGDRGLSGHSRFWRSVGQTLESGSGQVHVCRLGAGWGSLSQSKSLNSPGRAQA